MIANVISTSRISINWLQISVVIVAVLLVHLLIVRPVYNVYFHPLKRYPGPKLWAATTLPWGFWFMSGKLHHVMMELHNKYGPIVRLGPNELSYAVPEAWEDVYGRYQHGVRKENGKPTWYVDPKSNQIVAADFGSHGRMRRILGNGFTNTAMLEQEPLIKVHVDLFIQRLHEKAARGENPVDLFLWFSFCTFDLIGDLAFGEPFGCLRESMLHPWIDWVLGNIKLTHIILLCRRVPFFVIFLPVLTSIRLWRDYRMHQKTLRATCDRRMAREGPRADFMQVMMQEKGNMRLSREEIYSNAMILTLGGSETTSNSLAGMAYIIATHPEVKAKITKEVLAAFKRDDEINMRSAAKLPYLCAVIEETLRYYPPGPNAMWRMTPPDGNRILGDWVPGHTVLGIPHRVMYRAEYNFKRANEFIPERWIDKGNNTEFAKDRRDAFHPFSYGPRNCLAMHLAYAEMKFILARFIFNFEIEIHESSRNWMDDQRGYLIWEKPGLFVNLKSRVHDIAAP